MPAAVLLAEPEPTARTFLERHLIDNGFAVLSTPEEGRPHLVLTGDLEAVDAWRGEVPVIVLGQEEAGVVERVRAFEMGCDDYGETACPSPFSTARGRIGPLSCSAAGLFATLSTGGRPSGKRRSGWLVTATNPCTFMMEGARRPE